MRFLSRHLWGREGGREGEREGGREGEREGGRDIELLEERWEVLRMS